MRTATDILGQFSKADLFRHVLRWDSHRGDDTSVTGVLNLDAIAMLDADPRFARGGLHHLHVEVGKHRTEFRAHPGEIGTGSLQIVIDTQTGRFYADIDKFSPYTDGVNVIGHTFGEVVPGWLKKIGRVFRRTR